MADRAYNNPSIIKQNTNTQSKREGTYGNPTNMDDFKHHLQRKPINESESSDKRNASVNNSALNSSVSGITSHNSSTNSLGSLNIRHNGLSPGLGNSHNSSPVSFNRMTSPNQPDNIPSVPAKSMIASHSMPSTYQPTSINTSVLNRQGNHSSSSLRPGLDNSVNSPHIYRQPSPTNNYNIQPLSKPIDPAAGQRFPYSNVPAPFRPTLPSNLVRPALPHSPSTESVLPPGKPPPMMGVPFIPPMQTTQSDVLGYSQIRNLPNQTPNDQSAAILAPRTSVYSGQSPIPNMNVSNSLNPTLQQSGHSGLINSGQNPAISRPPIRPQVISLPGPHIGNPSSLSHSSQGPPYPAPVQPPPIPGVPGISNTTNATHSVTGRREYPSMNTMASPEMNIPSSYAGQGAQSNTFKSFENLSLQASDTVRPLNLLEDRHVLPAGGITNPKANLPHDLKQFNCDPEIFRCSLNCVPNSQSLLQKSRLPFGILIQPFKDLEDLPVIQTNTIVRCRSCRTYINPFVQFIDARRWKCNLCYRYNDLPDEFNYDPYTKVYQEPSNRPEIRNGTVEFIAPAEYTLRAPQPAVYLYCLDVSRVALESGYLQIFCDSMLKYFDSIPGDNRSQIGFITYDETLHFYNLDSELSQPAMLVVSDLDEVLLPNPDGLLVNVKESMDLIKMLLEKLVDTCESCSTHGNGSAVGACLQAAYKIMSSTGGRIMFVNSQLVSVGPGALKCREDPNERASQKITNLGPACDYYKRLALDCSTQQIAVDLFMINSSYSDIATLGEISRHSSGCMYYFPSFDTEKNKLEVHRFKNTLKRYLTRKIGFESVMRIRCSRGLEIEAFHGNFFVRSTNLLALANINPDSSFGAQLVIEDTIEANVVSLQAALLYTSSIGERRIRVHTICLPVTKVLSEVFAGADQQCIIGLVAKMGVKRSITSSISDAREAFVNVAVDALEAYSNSISAQRLGKLLCPVQLRLIPVYILALLKCSAMRIGTSTKLDSRVISLQRLVTLPLKQLLRTVHPDLYPIHMLESKENGEVISPPLLQLSSANIDSTGAYIMDIGLYMYLWVGSNISPSFCQQAFGQEDFNSMADCVLGVTKQNTKLNIRLHAFINKLNMDRAIEAPIIVMREGCASFHFITEKLIEDRTQSTFSYYEFLQHIQSEIKCT